MKKNKKQNLIAEKINNKEFMLKNLALKIKNFMDQ